jgi:hypothetical protein
MNINTKQGYKIKSETSRNFKVSKQNTTCYKLLAQAQFLLCFLGYIVSSVEVLVQLRNRDLCCDTYIVRIYPLNIVTRKKKKNCLYCEKA